MSDVLVTTNTYSIRTHPVTYGYDAGGRSHTLTYPTPQGEQVPHRLPWQGIILQGNIPDLLTRYGLGLPTARNSPEG